MCKQCEYVMAKALGQPAGRPCTKLSTPTNIGTNIQI